MMENSFRRFGSDQMNFCEELKNHVEKIPALITNFGKIYPKLLNRNNKWQ
jgi:hypothetical protein